MLTDSMAESHERWLWDSLNLRFIAHWIQLPTTGKADPDAQQLLSLIVKFYACLQDKIVVQVGFISGKASR